MERKFLFVGSVAVCLALAFAYIKVATPIYEVQASLLIDPLGKSRMLGESKYVDGAVGQIATEKNLFNEIGILKSYSLIDKALNELDFQVSYHAGNWLKQKEYYGYFPFSVTLQDSSAQLFEVPFEVAILSDVEYRLTIKGNKFYVSNPENGTKHEVDQKLEFDSNYRFGQEVSHDYFHFTINKPTYNVVSEDFMDKKLAFKIHSRDKLINEYKDKLKVEQFDIQADILHVKTTGPEMGKELAFLDKLTKHFIKSKFNERDDIATSKEDFIRKQLEGINDSLSLAEKRLENFQKTNNVVDLSLSASTTIDQLNTLESERAQIELSVKYYSSLSGYLNSSNGIEKIIAPSVVGIDDPLLNENLIELRRLHNEKTRLSYFKGELSYDRNVNDKQIVETTNSLRENIKNLLSSSEVALKDKNSRIKELEGKLNQLPTSQKNQLSFERKTTLYDNLSRYLNQELAKASIAKAEDIADTKVLDAPRMVGSGPISPQKSLIFLLAFIVGIIIPLTWVVFSSSEGDTMDKLDNIEAISSIPVVAKISHMDNATEGSPSWAMLVESFRGLAASLQFLVTDPDKNIIGVTSMVSGEGKSFCASNLGISLAAEGKSTLLIDLNFRHPIRLQGQNFQAGKTLSDYLNDRAPVDEIIQPFSNQPNLHFIPTLPGEKNPHFLLASPKLKTLLQALKYEYDFIIVDTPAVGLVTDYLLISKFVDIHLFILRRKLSKQSFLNEIQILKEKGKMENLFLVLNDLKKIPSINGYASAGKGGIPEGYKLSANLKTGEKSGKN
ncbi:MAG: AAA family ATPase [Saprospiraceae bacterium]|nr:AAA family ATPase [Saprospiraceae bacterium]MCF8250838.1 AAA family ATPase [Saprospiraceae bacterium]MCF8281655.1 AAA family ATPase [Bacteroidales bacterium]MCF8312639.1 AAA family ATPase [Saprospiraceae bacterium]MCF8441029.1 AAA family ATPase [Saprospiraceae bacterium]